MCDCRTCGCHKAVAPVAKQAKAHRKAVAPVVVTADAVPTETRDTETTDD